MKRLLPEHEFDAQVATLIERLLAQLGDGAAEGWLGGWEADVAPGTGPALASVEPPRTSPPDPIHGP